MAGEDLTSSRFAAPPREPLPESALDRGALIRLGERLVERTWADGLPAWFWGEGVCLAGITAFRAASGEEFPADVLAWLDGRAADVRIDHVNAVAPGIAAAAAVSAGHDRFGPACERLAAWVFDSPVATRTADGVLEHWPGGVWADTAFMAGGFLTGWARASGDRAVFAEAVRQVLGHYRVLQDDGGLCVHGSHRGETIRCFWGRANAWLALAAVGVLETAAGWKDAPGADRPAGGGGAAAVVSRPAHGATAMPDPSPNTVAAGAADVAELTDRLTRQLDALVAHQPDHGVWDVLVDGQRENLGVLETSAAAGIGAALLRAARVVPGGGRWSAPGRRAVRGALAYVDDGALTRVSAGTVLQLIPFGYSVIRDDRPQLWGQGLALHAIAAALA